jgi:hypothetical protein
MGRHSGFSSSLSRAIINNYEMSVIQSILRQLMLKAPFLRVFTSGECQYGDHFINSQSGYEGKVPYHLRFMIDKEVSVLK